MDDRLRRPGASPASASTACASSSSAAPSPPTRRASVASRRCSSKGRAARTRPCWRLARRSTARPLHAAAPPARRDVRHRRDHGAAPHHLTGRFVDLAGRADPPHAHRRRRAAEPHRPACAAGRRARPDGIGQVRRRDGRRPRRRGDARSSPSTPCRCTAAWTSARPSRRRPTERAVRHHGIDLVEPDVDFTVAEFQRGYDAAGWRPIAGRGRCSSAGTGLYLSAVVDDLDLPGEWPDVRADLEAESTTVGALCAAADRRSTRRRRRRIEPGNRRRIVRALEVTTAAAARSARSGPGSQAYPPTDVAQIGLRWARDVARPSASSGGCTR